MNNICFQVITIPIKRNACPRHPILFLLYVKIFFPNHAYISIIYLFYYLCIDNLSLCHNLDIFYPKLKEITPLLLIIGSAYKKLNHENIREKL